VRHNSKEVKRKKPGKAESEGRAIADRVRKKNQNTVIKTRRKKTNEGFTVGQIQKLRCPERRRTRRNIEKSAAETIKAQRN